MDQILDRLTGSVPDIITAILYLIIAFLIALISKKIIMGILNKTGAEKLLAKTGIEDEKTGKSTEFVGKLTFLIVFLLFLPAVLNKLGMSSVASPISNVVSIIIGYLPKILAAGIILYIGIYVAKVVKQLVKALLNRIGFDKLQKKLGIEQVDSQNTFTEVIAGIIYTLILIPVIIAALQTLGVDALSRPLMSVVDTLFAYLPSLFVAVILLVVGYQLAKILVKVIESLLISVGTDKLGKKLFSTAKTDLSISKIIAQIAHWLIMIIFFIEAVNVLKLSVITNLGAALLNYLPSIISALIIIGGGLILASWVEGLIIKHSPSKKPIALIVKVVIIVMASFMTLSQLGFAQEIVNQAFIIILAAAAVAFAIAFGVGGRTFAANRLEKLEKKLDDTSKDG